jgi:ATP-dependent DNA helicase RecG
MDLTQLVEQLRSRRSDAPAIEVKSAAGGLPDSLTSTMCAFGNLPGGGLIILGLDEANGFIPVGLEDASGLAAGLASRARQAFAPPLQLNVEVERFEGADVVVAAIVEVPVAAKPCMVKRTRKAYMRFADGDYTLSSLEVDGFVSNRERPRIDEAEVPGATMADLEVARIEDYVATARTNDRRLAKVADDHELLKRTGVLTSAGTPTLAGLLALGEYPQQFLPHCNVRAALLPDGDTHSIRALDSATFTGPIAAMLEDIVAWVAKNSRRRIVANPTTGTVSDFQDPPSVAIRELVANALVHRDLSEWATSRAIDLRMDSTSFRLSNPGGLYGISADRLGLHPLTSARNRRLVEICKFVRTTDGNVVEALATGIPAAIDSLRTAGMQEPEFFDQGLAFTVIIRRSHADAVRHTSTEHRLAEAIAESSFTKRTEHRTRDAISRSPVFQAAEHKIRDALGISPAATVAESELLDVLERAETVTALANVLGLSRNAVHKRLATLRAKGLVAIVGGPGQTTTYVRNRKPNG